MPVLPAICERCSNVFSSGFSVGGSVHLTMVGNRAGPCPNCGGWGRIPDGVYDVVGETISVLATTRASAEAWARLAAILDEGRKRRQSPATVAASIERNAPEFKGLSGILGRLRGVRTIEWITMALAVIAIAQGMAAAESSSREEAKIDQIYNTLISGQKHAQPAGTGASPPPAATSGQPATRPGRNDPCWCGSGLKFKKCHGR